MGMTSFQEPLGEHQEHIADTVEGIPADEHHQAQHTTVNEQGAQENHGQILQHLQYAHHHHPPESPLQSLQQHHNPDEMGHAEHDQAHTLASEQHGGEDHHDQHPVEGHVEIDGQIRDDAESQTIGIPVASNFDHHLLDSSMALYQHGLAHFNPQTYQQQLALYQQGYMVQGVPHPDLAHPYHDSSGEGQDRDKHPEMSSVEEEAAAAHLTALRNTGRVEGHDMEGGRQEGMVEPMSHMAAMQSMHEHSMEAFNGMDPNTVNAGKSTPSKRKSWRVTHEGEGLLSAAEAAENGKVRRKQKRRPDRLCHFEGCFVTPTYNYPNEKKRIFCVTHKLEGMINVVAKRCGHPDCAVNPRFNYEGITRGVFCSEHKLEGMVNVIDRRCQEPDCTKFPSHNYPNSHKKLYCATHKREDMVDMSHGNQHV